MNARRPVTDGKAVPEKVRPVEIIAAITFTGSYAV